MAGGLSVSTASTGTLDGGSGTLYSAGLTAGADAATATIRTGGSGGVVLCKLSAAAGESVERRFVLGVGYGGLHVTLTGTSPTLDVEL